MWLPRRTLEDVDGKWGTSGRVLFLVTVPSWAQRLLCLICVLCESLAWSRKRALGGPTLLLHFSTSSHCLGSKGNWGHFS